ncbi:hypothetical protein [Brevundimonas sp. NPDC058933]|uniref:hypothetical protein n=1 Tax=Brevundimonas sp. NPDC058933 TaxID=3346673 RepID=UPI003BEEBE52
MNHTPSSRLTISYIVSLSGDRATIREALNWCFDNSVSFNLHEACLYDEETVGDWADFTLTFRNDRDAVLFKTFWNDR